jgi:hypothetical protein
MAYGPEILTVWRWGQRLADWLEAIRARLPTLSERWLLLVSAVGLALYAIFLRCFHLLDSAHNYILSADSYFFHWAASGIMDGAPPNVPPGGESAYVLHSGLVYPLAYLAKAASAVFGLSSGEALDLTCKALPPVIGLISMITVYWVASRIYDRRVGLFAAFAWASVLHAVLVGAAGYVDRDGLSILLIAVGAFLFYFSEGWHLRVHGRDCGWLLAVLGVLSIEVVLYLYWSFAGAVLLLIIIASYSLVRYLVGYADRLRAEPDMVRRLKSAFKDVNWRAFAALIGGNVLIMVIAVALRPEASFWSLFIQEWVETIFGESAVAELAGLRAGDLLSYYFFYIPIAAALILGWQKRADSVVFFSTWFICFLVLSLFTARVLLYALPAACLLSGVGLAYIWGWKNRGQYQWLKKLSVAGLFLLLVLTSLQAYSLGANPRMSPDDDWREALAYLRDSTPQDSVVMTWWDYGYWILDVGDRQPVIDNGYYAYDEDRLRDVALAYVGSDASEVAMIMDKHGASYLVFSDLELDFAEQILRWVDTDAGTYEGMDAFPRDSLVLRCLEGRFDSEGGLKVVHRSAPEGDVVILQLTGSAQT